MSRPPYPGPTHPKPTHPTPTRPPESPKPPRPLTAEERAEPITSPPVLATIAHLVLGKLTELQAESRSAA